MDALRRGAPDDGDAARRRAALGLDAVRAAAPASPGGDDARARVRAEIADEAARARKAERKVKDLEARLAAATNDDKVQRMEKEMAELRRRLAGGDATETRRPLEELEEELRSAADRFLSGDGSAEGLLDELHEQIQTHPEMAKRKAREASKWDADQAPLNQKALRVMRGLVPVDITSSSLQRITDEVNDALGPGREALAKKLTKRIWGTQSLWLIRMPTERIRRSHIADFRTRWAISGLDIVELRALYRASASEVFPSFGPVSCSGRERERRPRPYALARVSRTAF